MGKTRCCAAVVLLAGVCAVQAMPIEIGSGDKAAGIYIEWKDGFGVEFVVRFEQESISGLDLIRRAAADSSLTLDVQSYEWGEMLNGIAYAGHINEGYDGGDDWWHYWVKDPEQDWISPQTYGASERVVADGSWDGWVYGRATIPEPAVLIFVGTGVLFVRRRAIVKRPR